MALISLTVSHPMRACENRFLSVSCSAKPFSLTYRLDVCELALSSLFPLAGFCMSVTVLNLLDPGFILVCIITATQTQL